MVTRSIRSRYMWVRAWLFMAFCRFASSDNCPDNILGVNFFDIIEPRGGDILTSSHLRVKLGYHVDDAGGEQFRAHKHLLQLCLFYGGRKKCFRDIYREYSVLITSPAGHAFDVSAKLCGGGDPNFCYCSSQSIVSVTQSAEARASITPVCLLQPRQRPLGTLFGSPVLKVQLLLGQSSSRDEASLWESVRSVVAASNAALSSGRIAHVSYTVVAHCSSEEDCAASTDFDRAFAYNMREFVLQPAPGMAASERHGDQVDLSLYLCGPNEAISVLQCALFSTRAQAEGHSPVPLAGDVLVFVSLSPPRGRVVVKESALVELAEVLHGAQTGAGATPPCLALGSIAQSKGAAKLPLTERMLAMAPGAARSIFMGPQLTHWLPAVSQDYVQGVNFALRRDALDYFADDWLAENAEPAGDAGAINRLNFDFLVEERVPVVGAHPPLFA